MMIDIVEKMRKARAQAYSSRGSAPRDMVLVTASERDALCDEVERLRAEVEALRKDAERYRWLLAHAVSENDDGEKCIYYWCDFEHYDDVSASIDAAMKEKPLPSIIDKLIA
jgi:hypothetical protein